MTARRRQPATLRAALARGACNGVAAWGMLAAFMLIT